MPTTQHNDDQIVVANAPISYGAFELTVGVDPRVLNADELIEQVAGAGYAGIDLGPVGYLGDATSLRSRLESHELGLAGGYLELPYSDPAGLDRALPELDALLDVFDLVEGIVPAPKPTLADAGSTERRQRPGRAADDKDFGLDDAGWERFAEGLALVVDRCRARGYDPTFHCETGTYVEAEWEVDRVMEVSDIGLCLETGHVFVGGGDSLSVIAKWGDRINHVHLKDASAKIVRAIVDDGDDNDAVWRRRAFCALGAGDVPLDDILDALAGIGYGGWLVVEQDIIPRDDDPEGDAQRQQIANREFLRARGL